MNNHMIHRPRSQVMAHPVSKAFVFSNSNPLRDKKERLPVFFALAGLVLIGAALLAPQAHAQSAQKKADQLQQEINFAEEVKDAEKKCGAKISTEVDWAAFEKGEWQKANYSLYSYCANAGEALERLCVGKRSQAYVKANVKKIRCTLAPKGKRKIIKKGKTLIFSMDPKASNNAEWARGEVLGQL